MRIRQLAAPLLTAIALGGCSAPLELGIGGTIGRDGIGWQGRIGFHPLGLVHDAASRDSDVGVGLAYQGGAEESAWLVYLQGTSTVWRHPWSDDSAARWRAGGELHYDTTHRGFGFALVSRLDAGQFIDFTDDRSAYWGEVAGGLLLAAAWDETFGPSLLLGAQMRLPAGATADIPDRM